MARRNDRDMRKSICLMFGLLLASLICYAQEDNHLKRMTKDLVRLRSARVSNDSLNKLVIAWSTSGSPKMTLMDDVKRDIENEYRGNNANKFKINQVVTYVYERQNTGLVSRGDYFNSNEKDIFYSAIEKTVRKGCTVKYSLTGHAGKQEFVFVAFNPKTKFTATVNGKKAVSIGDAVQSLSIGKVEKGEKIILSITNESKQNESFVILNHNPQK